MTEQLKESTQSKEKFVQSTEKKSTEFETEYKWWENLEKLEALKEAYFLDCTDEEACANAQITPDQLYYYQKYVNPEFQVKKHIWKRNPELIARKSLVRGLSKNPDLSLRYLERKNKAEFSLRQELTGAGGKDLPVPILGGVTIKDNEV